tara:strand:- start:51025 stop:51186 length:162 start_codon:yes stop_codon:yes gene_type:complete
LVHRGGSNSRESSTLDRRDKSISYGFEHSTSFGSLASGNQAAFADSQPEFVLP